MINKCESNLGISVLVRWLELGFKIESLKVYEKGSSAQSNRPQMLTYDYRDGQTLDKNIRKYK